MRLFYTVMVLCLFSVPALADIYYVRPTNGSDVAAGTSFAAAKKTFAGAIAAVTAGTDTEIRLCAEATESVGTEIDIGLVATGTTPLRIRGMDGTDGSTAATYTLQASASITNLVDIEALAAYLYFENIVFDGNANAANAVNLTDAVKFIGFHRCRFTDAAVGINNDSGSSASAVPRVVSCEIDNNSGNGVTAVSNSDGGIRLIGCSIHDNGDAGAQLGYVYCVINQCLFYDNTSHAVEAAFASADNAFITENTFYEGDGGSIAAVYWNSGGGGGTTEIVRNIFIGFSTAIDLNGVDVGALFIAENCFYNNTNDTDVTVYPDTNNVTSDPQFVRTTDGSEDFRLQSGSPCFQGGYGNRNIGALGTETDSSPVQFVLIDATP